MIETIGFRSIIEAFENLGKIRLDMSLYMEICGDEVELHIAETMNQFNCQLYVQHFMREPNRAFRVATGGEIFSIIRSEKEKVDIERLIEMYGAESEEANSDEEESDLTQEELREKAIPRVETKLTEMVGEIIKKNLGNLSNDSISVYWNDENIINYKLRKK